MSSVEGITASAVTVTYRNGHTALHNANFNIPPGSITGLVGVNGAENQHFSKQSWVLRPFLQERYVY